MTQRYLGREIAGVTLGSNLKERLREQGEHVEGLKKGAEKEIYTNIRGDYSDRNDDLLASSEQDYTRSFERHNVNEVVGLEQYFADLIERLLEIKKGQEPVVAVDVGGMFGLTWSRLADHFADRIKAGEVALVVSNITRDPAKQRNDPNEYKHFSFTEEEVALLQKTSPLLHLISGTARLDRQQIQLPNHQILPLKHAADIIYEYFSLTAWSKVPDLDILKMAKLLSPYGMYFTEHNVNRIIRGERTTEEKTERLTAIELARQQLVDYGLTRRTQVEAGKMKGKQLRYDVFKGPLAPPITLD